MANRKRSEAARVAHYARNIARTFAQVDARTVAEAREWYAAESDALACLALELELPLRSVCGAAAAISPGMRWELVPDYVRALAGAGRYSVKVPTYSSEFTRRAIACIEGENPEEVLGGEKVRAFYALLYTRGQADAVVIDGHAFNIARGSRAPIRGEGVPKAARVTAARYRWAAKAYRKAAAMLGLLPHELQAVTWVYWRTI